MNESGKGRVNTDSLKPQDVLAPVALLGFALAIFLAQLDFIARVVQPTQIFSELSQDILVGLLLCQPVFLMFGGIVLLLQKYIGLTLSVKSFRRYLFLFASFLLLISAALILLATIELSLFQGSTSFEQLLVFVLVPLLSALFVFCLFELSSLETSWLKHIVSRYVLILSALLAILLLIDTLRYSSAVPGKPVKKVAQQASKLPNIVILCLDGLRPEFLLDSTGSLNKSGGQHIFMRPGLFFSDAQSSNPDTAIAHAALLSGRYFPLISDTGQAVSGSHRALGHILSEQGYDTAGFVGGGCCKGRSGIESGFEFFDDRLDFIEFESSHPLAVLRRFGSKLIPPGLRKLLGSNNRRTSEQLNQAAFRWLEERARFDKPFFLYLQYNDLLAFADERSSANAIDFNQAQRQSLQREYFQRAQELQKAAEELGEQLELLGFLENTVLVVTSAHGFELFEHGGFGRALSLYQELLHVPLFISYPEILKESRVPQLSGAVDIMPTLLDLLKIPANLNIDGRSLLPLVNGLDESLRPLLLAQVFPAAHSQHANSKALITADWKLIVTENQHANREVKLYHRKEDRDEQTDRSKSEIQVLERLSWTLEKLLDR